MFGQRSGAAAAYDQFAPFYDAFNAQNDYEIWIGGLRTLALLGQSKDGPGASLVLREPLDEARAYKAIYIGDEMVRKAGPAWSWGQPRDYWPFEVKAAGLTAAVTSIFNPSTPSRNPLSIWTCAE
jgi:hypothetical protein